MLDGDYFYKYLKDKDSKLGRAYISFNINVNGEVKIATMILNIDDYSMDYIYSEVDKVYEALTSKNYFII